ncbi:uncharacterized protein LOC111269286 [Varroa jacobsoni]|uniref:uncharacterized protein LOC111269286 n=1 Tax=Varroa jacobsoni TaxID=62625 RepID=UPI000BF6E5BC|nr:uncharacterized protein LOC111269286 [Varroa jacobsoni]
MRRDWYSFNIRTCFRPPTRVQLCRPQLVTAIQRHKHGPPTSQSLRRILPSAPVVSVQSNFGLMSWAISPGKRTLNEYTIGTSSCSMRIVADDRVSSQHGHTCRGTGESQMIHVVGVGPMAQ